MLGKLVVGEIAVGKDVSGKLCWGSNLTPFVNLFFTQFHPASTKESTEKAEHILGRTELIYVCSIL